MKKLNEKQQHVLDMVVRDAAIELNDPVLASATTRAAVFATHEGGPYLFLTATALLDNMTASNVTQFLRNVSQLIGRWEMEKASEELQGVSEKDLN